MAVLDLYIISASRQAKAGLGVQNLGLYRKLGGADVKKYPTVKARHAGKLNAGAVCRDVNPTDGRRVDP